MGPGARRDGPGTGLDAIDAIDTRPLTAYHHLPASRADLLRRLGRESAPTAYRQALTLVDNERERTLLERCRLLCLRSCPGQDVDKCAADSSPIVVAPPGRFELPTPALGERCSIP